MSLLIDPVNSGVDNQVASLEGATVEPQVKQEPEGFAVPDKFKGKSAEDIARSYVELEKEFGRVRNDVGEYRTLTDRLLQIEEKRVKDLEGAGQKTVDKFEIDAAELLTNPRETLEKWYEHRKLADPVFTEVQERLARIEGQAVQKEVLSRHQDAAEVTNSPEFLSWVQEHPVRLNIARAAVQNQDLDSLDYLLTEYKGKTPRASAPEPKQESEASRAKRVATESASSGSPTNSRTGGDKVFSRRRLIDLKIRNPEEYAAMQDQILSAYAEGRVVD